MTVLHTSTVTVHCVRIKGGTSEGTSKKDWFAHFAERTIPVKDAGTFEYQKPDLKLIELQEFLNHNGNFGGVENTAMWSYSLADPAAAELREKFIKIADRLQIMVSLLPIDAEIYEALHGVEIRKAS